MRLSGWENRFYALVENVRYEPFEWGKFDCMTFAAMSVEAITGKKVLDDVIGTYSDVRSAYDVLNGLGGTAQAIENRVSALADNKYHTYAQTGDIVIVSQETLKSQVGIMINGRVCGPSYKGLSSQEIQGGYAWCF